MTPAFVAQTLKQNSSEAGLTLVTISHPDITAQRFAQNAVDVVSRGNTFNAYAIDAPLPSDNRDFSARSTTLTVSNVKRQLIDELRSVTGPLSVLVEIVSASDPDTVQQSYSLEWRGETYDDKQISAKLQDDGFLDDAFPRESFTPQRNPGLFGRTQ